MRRLLFKCYSRLIVTSGGGLDVSGLPILRRRMALRSVSKVVVLIACALFLLGLHACNLHRRQYTLDTTFINTAETGDIESASALLRKGANIEVTRPELVDSRATYDKESGLTALGIAALRGDTKMVAFLLSRGANIHAQTPKSDGFGGEDGVLLPAARGGSAPVVKILLDRGADVNVGRGRGVTPLMIAAAFNHPEVVRMLIARGADLSAHDERGWSVLRFAQRRSKRDDASEVIRLLRQAGAK